MDFKTAFEKLKIEIETADPKKLTENFAIQITMTDEDCGGTFYVSHFDGTLMAEPYDYRDNTAAIKISRSDLRRLLSGRSKAENLIKNGKMNFSGDLGSLMELIAAMPEPPTEVALTEDSKKPVKKPLGNIEGISAKSKK